MLEQTQEGDFSKVAIQLMCQVARVCTTSPVEQEVEGRMVVVRPDSRAIGHDGVSVRPHHLCLQSRLLPENHALLEAGRGGGKMSITPPIARTDTVYLRSLTSYHL